MAIANHLIYILVSLAFTVCVGRSLYRNGMPFLLECWGQTETAAAVNRFFLVGFYLMNLAFVLLILKYGATGTSLETSMEILGERIGLVALVMGGMHFNNLFWCLRFRSRRHNQMQRRLFLESHERI